MIFITEIFIQVVIIDRHQMKNKILHVKKYKQKTERNNIEERNAKNYKNVG